MNKLPVVNRPLVCPTIVGRANELATLHAILDEVGHGHSRVVLLSGEAGIGKSRLVAEAKSYAIAQDFLLFQGLCLPTDHSSPYAPLLDLLRSHLAASSQDHLAAELGSLASVLSPLLPDLFPPSPDLPPLSPLAPEQEKRRIFAALAQFFVNQARKQAVLLIIEDIHWSDETSLEFLHYLARHSTTQPLLLLLSYRSDEVRPHLRQFLAQLDRERLAQELWLAHLTRDDVDAMLRAIFSLPARRPWR